MTPLSVVGRNPAAGGPSPSGASGRFRVKDWAAIGFGLETQEQWRAWACGATPRPIADPPPPAGVPSLLRRRVTPLGQRALRAAYGLAGSNVRYVFCSRHGEFQRTLELLQTIARREPISPAEFSLSVHNALAGLLSIATHNQAGHTALAAGPDSFGFGLLEALGCLAEQPHEPVLLVYFDEPLPPPYTELAESDTPHIALAMLLAPPEMARGDLILSIEPGTGSGEAPAPRCQASDFLTFFLSERSELVYSGGRRIWRWTRVT